MKDEIYTIFPLSSSFPLSFQRKDLSALYSTSKMLSKHSFLMRYYHYLYSKTNGHVVREGWIILVIAYHQTISLSWAIRSKTGSSENLKSPVRPLLNTHELDYSISFFKSCFQCYHIVVISSSSIHYAN